MTYVFVFHWYRDNFPSRYLSKGRLICYFMLVSFVYVCKSLIYIYTCIYTYISISLYIYICVCIYINVYIYICIYGIYIYIHIYKHIITKSLQNWVMTGLLTILYIILILFYFLVVLLTACSFLLNNFVS